MPLPSGAAAPAGRATQRTAACAVLVVALAGCASVPPVAGPGAFSASTRLALVGQELTAVWTRPAGPPRALVTLQHGFARRCANLATTAARLAGLGLLTLCIDAPMARGNPALADALAAALSNGLPGPDGAALPERIIVAGHSAGAAFAARLGARLDAVAPARLAGAILFDPVATNSFAADLRSLARAGLRPVLAVTAPASGCNAQHSAYSALRSLRTEAQAAGHDNVVGIELGAGASHADVEGEDSDWIAAAACGRPLPSHTESLRTLAAQWASAVADGAPPRLDLPAGATPID